MLTAELLVLWRHLELPTRALSNTTPHRQPAGTELHRPGNYNLRHLEVIGKAAGPGLTPVRDARAGRRNSAVGPFRVG